MIRVLVVDDHPVFRAGLRQALSDAADVDVVGEAVDGASALAAVLDTQPQVALMDLRLPGVNGIEATRQVVAACPGTAVLVLTMHDDDESVFAAMRAGARGYLVKGASGERIADAVRAVAAGDVVFGADVAEQVLRYFAASRRGGRAGRPFPSLTEREVEILELVAAGRSNTEIARRLVLSAKTVRNHMSNIFAKLAVSDRAQAIVRAREAGLGSDP